MTLAGRAARKKRGAHPKERNPRNSFSPPPPEEANPRSHPAPSPRLPGEGRGDEAPAQTRNAASWRPPLTRDNEHANPALSPQARGGKDFRENAKHRSPNPA